MCSSQEEGQKKTDCCLKYQGIREKKSSKSLDEMLCLVRKMVKLLLTLMIVVIPLHPTT